jgi:nitroimidazol reductase NimA-like FMN-containing flavoprotein (pyridoxamine 5'-phosphate oxidase superfamily)
MNDEERQTFLDRPFSGIVSTLGPGPGATVHSVPVWYDFRDGIFVIWTDAGRRWVRNIERNDKVSIVVAEHEAPYAAVIAHGTAEVTIDEAGMDDAIRGIVEKYIPEAEVDDYIGSWSSLRTIVRITPTLLRSWGRGY